MDLDKVRAYIAVQESGFYNMIDPRARKLAEEMSEIEISKQDWVYIMENYRTLKEELV